MFRFFTTTDKGKTMQKTWRQQLISSRLCGLEAYAASLDACPDCTGHAASIAGIFIAPIKSLGMLELKQAMVTPHGLATTGGIPDRGFMLARRVHDRRWNFERFTHRESPLLEAITPVLDGGTIRYRATAMDDLVLRVDDFRARGSQTVSVRLSGDDDILHLTPENGKMTTWIQQFLRQNDPAMQDVGKIHVLCLPTSFHRSVEPRHACGTTVQTLLSDGGQVLVTSESTLAWMNEQLHEPVNMDAFRPNIVLNGLAPNMEDVIDSMKIGRHELQFADPCVRCIVTTVNRGQFRSDKQPLKFLSMSRPARPPENKGATFGVNCVLTGSGWSFYKGDALTVLAEK